jgi:THO complex subunit 2
MQLAKARDEGAWREEDAADVTARQEQEQAAAEARQKKAKEQMADMIRESEKITQELGTDRRGWDGGRSGSGRSMTNSGDQRGDQRSSSSDVRRSHMPPPTAPKSSFPHGNNVGPVSTGSKTAERSHSPLMTSGSLNTRTGEKDSRMPDDRVRVQVHAANQEDRWSRGDRPGQGAGGAFHRNSRQPSPGRGADSGTRDANYDASGGVERDNRVRSATSSSTLSTQSKRSRDPSPEEGETDLSSLHRSKRLRNDATDDEGDESKRRRQRGRRRS